MVTHRTVSIGEFRGIAQVAGDRLESSGLLTSGFLAPSLLRAPPVSLILRRPLWVCFGATPGSVW